MSLLRQTTIDDNNLGKGRMMFKCTLCDSYIQPGQEQPLDSSPDSLPICIKCARMNRDMCSVMDEVSDLISNDEQED